MTDEKTGPGRIDTTALVSGPAKPETDAERVARLSVERECRRMADAIMKALPPGVGFALFLYDFGEAGALAYCANGEREGVLKMLREFIAREEGGA